MTAQSFARPCARHILAVCRQPHSGHTQKKEMHKNEKAYKKFAGRTKMLNFAIITDMHNAYGDIQGNLNHTL